MAYSVYADVKLVLHIDVEDTAYDAEITDCITSADGLINSIANGKGLTVPTSVPQSIEDASKYLAAHIFRARRLPAPEPILYELGMIFLNGWMGTYQVGKIV